MRTLIWKELRENARWLPVGLILVALVAWSAAPSRFEYSQMTITQTMLRSFSILLPLLAFALAIVQSFRDLQPAAGDYLHHRGVTTLQVFIAKTIAGFCLYGLAVGMPLLGFAGWIGMQGLHWHPMRPAQVVPPIVYGLAAFLMYPEAMLMMVRNASWWGTRWFPLVPVVPILILFYVMLGTHALVGAGYGTIAAMVALGGLVAIACQGWQDLAGDPPASRQGNALAGRSLVPSYLTLSSVAVIFAMVVLALIVADSLVRSAMVPTARLNRLAIRADSGEPWLLTYQQDRTAIPWKTAVIAGERIESGKLVDPSQPLDRSVRFIDLVELSELDQWDYRDDGFFSWHQYRGGSPASALVFDHRGYLLSYEYNPQRWQQTIAADGTYHRITYSIAPRSLSGPANRSDHWAVLLPGILLLTFIGVTVWTTRSFPPEVTQAIEQTPTQFLLFCVIGCVVLITAWILVAIVARIRALRRGQAIAWSLAVPLLGLATPLAILAIYRRVYWEPCPRCDKLRRIDQNRCVHCGGQWEPPQSEGIEISDAPQHTNRAGVTAPT